MYKYEFRRQSASKSFPVFWYTPTDMAFEMFAKTFKPLIKAAYPLQT
jgi:hypothetical protein